MASYMDYIGQGMDPSQAAYRAKMDQMGVGPSILPGLQNLSSNMQQAVFAGGGDQKVMNTFEGLNREDTGQRYVDSLNGIRQQPGLTYHALGPNGTATMGYNANQVPIPNRNPNTYSFGNMINRIQNSINPTPGSPIPDTPYAIDPGSIGQGGGKYVGASTPYGGAYTQEPLQFDNSTQNLGNLFPQVNYGNDQSTNRGARYFQSRSY